MCSRTPILRARGFIQQHLIFTYGVKKARVKAGGGDKVYRHAKRVLQVEQKPRQLKAADAALVNPQINITVVCHISAGIGTEQIDALCAILPGKTRHSNGQ